MRLIPSFKPSITYGELNAVLARTLFSRNDAAEGAGGFLRAFGDYLPAKHVLPFPAARWALYAVLSSLGFKEGDEVLVPAFTYFAVPAAVVRAGLKPVFVDIEPGSLAIDTEQAEKHVTSRTRAIIPTHLNGFACDIEAVASLARQHGLRIIEDCAQSPGASFKGKKLGTFGDAAYFTFGITKSFTTVCGSVAVVNDDGIARNAAHISSSIMPRSAPSLAAAILKAYCMKWATSFLFPAVLASEQVSRLAGIDVIDRLFREGEATLADIPRRGSLSAAQGALGISRLHALDRNNEARMRNGMLLYRMLRTVKDIRVPGLQNAAVNTFSGCPVFVERREEVRRSLLGAGIGTSAGYMRDCSSLETFRDPGGRCPNAARAEATILHLPSYPELTEKDIVYMCETLEVAVRMTGQE